MRLGSAARPERLGCVADAGPPSMPLLWIALLFRYSVVRFGNREDVAFENHVIAQWCSLRICWRTRDV